jgi:hypothetical protein
LTRQNEFDNNNSLSSRFTRPLSPINDKEQMQLVKNIAIAVRDLLQTLDYAPATIKEMVNEFFLIKLRYFIFIFSPNNVIIIFQI